MISNKVLKRIRLESKVSVESAESTEIAPINSSEKKKPEKYISGITLNDYFVNIHLLMSIAIKQTCRFTKSDKWWNYALTSNDIKFDENFSIIILQNPHNWQQNCYGPQFYKKKDYSYIILGVYETGPKIPTYKILQILLNNYFGYLKITSIIKSDEKLSNDVRVVHIICK